MDWTSWLGNISEVFNVIVSSVALFFAVIAGKEAKRLRQEDIESQRRTQASKISAWVADVKEPNNDKKWRHVGIVVQNLSEEPVYDLCISAQCQADKKTAVPLKLDFLPVGIFYCQAKSPDSGFIDFVPITEGSSCKSSDAWGDAKLLSELNPSPKPVTSTSHRSVGDISFRDAEGIHWKRKKKGSLVKL
ncbi:MAG: hypothetical protein Q4A84_02955 [Neisseria sp.]|uniref:hypothetical protein n=1 Tax=Neisseria sp. TaxID=192066 RepID=UPI0026DC7214|nr:hypothetical protein [Neisseria sp.]MDO4640649.1 hypothetical protein [Neisseria sp.]